MAIVLALVHDSSGFTGIRAGQEMGGEMQNIVGNKSETKKKLVNSLSAHDHLNMLPLLWHTLFVATGSGRNQLRQHIPGVIHRRRNREPGGSCPPNFRTGRQSPPPNFKPIPELFL